MSLRPLARACALALSLPALTAATAVAANPIETTYKVAGPAGVATANVTDASGNVTYNLLYPANLATSGVAAPIVTWGNGTGATPSQYSGLLNQLASWGFVVVASTSTTTGTGAAMLSGAQYLVAQNATAGGVFYHHLDTTKIAAVGHSQGAGGAVNATNNSGGLITTTIPIALPNDIWVSAGDEYYPELLTVPVLFLGGSSDVIISSPSTIAGFYNDVPGAAAKAVLKGAGHNTIQGTGGGFLGYITAWLRYRLAGDTYARGAFAGAAPEINANTSWQNQAEKHVP
ncbi:MAG TPA: alpha/beta hydrolase [Baekduia sp.]|nr:alpha/beta hydrolase [Baekduia sp.]